MKRLTIWVRRLAGVALLVLAARLAVDEIRAWRVRPAQDPFVVGSRLPRGLDLNLAIDAAAELAERSSRPRPRRAHWEHGLLVVDSATVAGDGAGREPVRTGDDFSRGE